jgi:hypothetical protein
VALSAKVMSRGTEGAASWFHRVHYLGDQGQRVYGVDRHGLVQFNGTLDFRSPTQVLPPSARAFEPMLEYWRAP